jgi:hypothetical protein
MANRQSRPVGSQPSARHETARVVLHKNSVPGWFWGLLGFLSVVAIGSTGLLLAAKAGVLGLQVPPPASTVAVVPAVATPPAAGTPPAVPAAGPPAAPAQPSGPKIVPLAAPPAPAAPIAATPPKGKVLPHPIKLAHSPAAGGHEPAAKAAAADDKPAAEPDEAPAAKKPAAEAAPADDGRVHIHHAAASDSDDDDSDN